jgi:septal ring factor EnvC (AmiA/AmiB activator)
MNISRFLFIITFLFCCNLFCQSKSELENQRKDLLNDIKKIEKKLLNTKQEKGFVLANAEDVNFKVKLQENLINNINDQLNLIVSEIDYNENKLRELNSRELSLKNELSKMILKSYKKRSDLNKIMFIFSSTSFAQAYKRIQYFKQYSNFQNKTINKIKSTTKEINITIKVLDSQKIDKQNLIKENKIIKKELSDEYVKLNGLIFNINKNQKEFVSQIKSKQKLSIEIDRKINKLIAEAIAKSKKNQNSISLTAEAQLISKNFNTNKGKLPWPVSKGYVVLGFGKQPHPIVKTTTIQSNGVRIRTSKDIQARSIFNGVIYSIILSKNNTYTVLIQHGNFFTVYKNLSEIFISKGDKVSTKELIGKIATDVSTQQTILSFSIFKDGTPQNPSSWIFKM